MNVVVLSGRLTADPELKLSGSGMEVVPFTVAVDRGADKQADFINCVAFSKTASFINKYFHKGKLILLEGRIQTRKYEDKTGAKRTATEVIVNKAHFAGDKKANFDGEKDQEIDLSDSGMDDLPF